MNRTVEDVFEQQTMIAKAIAQSFVAASKEPASAYALLGAFVTQLCSETFDRMVEKEEKGWEKEATEKSTPPR